MTTMETAETLDFQTRLTARSRSTEIPESADAYGWLVGNWELEVRHYWGIDVSAFVQTDVTREPEVAGLVGATLAAYGRLDVAFNNAGVEGTPGSIHEQTVENYQHIMDANVLGVFLSLKHEIATMLKGGGGAIVNNASVAGLVGFPGAALYVASKHAVLGLTKSAALEYATQGIRVNAVAPGAIETPMFDRFTAALGTDSHRQIAALHPMGRTGQTGEIAATVLWLCSDEASFVTGQSLAVDGGWTAK